MLQSEFFERTNVNVSPAEFEQIHKEYMHSDLWKDDFCAQWVKNNAYSVRLNKVYVQLEENRNKIVGVARKAFDKLNEYPTMDYPAIVVLTLSEMKTLENCGIHLFKPNDAFRTPKSVRSVLSELRDKFGFI